MKPTPRSVTEWLRPAEAVIGVDEAGRGCLAGPVVAAAFIPCGPLPSGLRDSKKLSAKQRTALFALLTQGNHRWSVGIASAREVDGLNILRATLLAMQKAVVGLAETEARLVVIDGNQMPELPTGYRGQCVVGGDDLVEEVSAASVIAKHWRDLHMQRLDALHPGYGFAAHKGYGVPEHLHALAKLGPCVEHRLTFAPVKAVARC